MPTRDALPTPAEVTLCPAMAEEFEQLLALRIAAMRESLERIGRFDPKRARQRFHASFAPECTQHVLWRGQKVGFVAVTRNGQGLSLDHLYIQPEQQGRGIGAAVLARVFAEADALAVELRVAALRESASNRFYQRHGFVLFAEGPWDLYYVRAPRRT